MTRPARVVASAAAAIAAVGFGACGNKSSASRSGGGQKASTSAPSDARKGGTLNVLYHGDVDYIDPGATYYQYGFNVAYATQRPLFSYKPDQSKAVPDLAAGPARISPDGKTVTVKLRSGVRFSPPVDRAVTSADVKYALERGFMSSVQNGYATAYFGDVVGAPRKTVKAHRTISGFETPDPQTLMIKLRRPRGEVVAEALSLPLSAPVPPEYAGRFDARNPSTYGGHQVATGPYMIRNDASGKAVGYRAGRSIALVRNPNWSASTDYKPAYVNRIRVEEGLDPTVASREITLGRNSVSGDFQLTSDVLGRGVGGKLKGSFLVSPPTGRTRYVALNTKIPPFDDANVRKAVIAGMDRAALRQAFGGPATGLLATHFIAPGIDGFQEAGGYAGPDADFAQNPHGNGALAARYLKKAGFRNGKYSGPQIQMVADNATQQKKVAEVVGDQLSKLGFRVQTRFTTRDTMYTAFCNVPAKKIQVCPSVSWLRDFPDPETMLFLTFKGANIQPNGNSNWPQLDVKKIDQAMDRGELLQDPRQRAKVWGQIDDQIVHQAPAVPWLWDTQPVLQSKNVNGVINTQNAAFDFTYTSIR